MSVLAWVLQVACALIFLISGSLKSTMSKQRMIATGQTGVAPFPLPILRVVAISEVLGAVGLIVPWLTGIARVLTPVAAIGLAVIISGAAVSHASLKEYRQSLLVNVPILAALVVVVVIRVGQL